MTVRTGQSADELAHLRIERVRIRPTVHHEPRHRLGSIDHHQSARRARFGDIDAGATQRCLERLDMWCCRHDNDGLVSREPIEQVPGDGTHELRVVLVEQDDVIAGFDPRPRLDRHACSVLVPQPVSLAAIRTSSAGRSVDLLIP